jgi:SAM-dependent methyltransferase
MDDVEDIRRYYEAILPYYDNSLADRGDLPFWEALARRWNPARILDLGCGTGRVTAVLNRVAPVVAVDLLPEMLVRAFRNAPGAQLVAADLRQFAFAELFDLIVLADDPMAHLISLDDRRNVMRLIADHLSPGGRVVIEGLYRQAGTAVPPNESWSATDDPSVWSAHYRFKKNDATVNVSTVMRSWSQAEVDQLTDAGLQIENVWGDFDERPFASDSKRIIIVAGRSLTSRTAVAARGSTGGRP